MTGHGNTSWTDPQLATLTDMWTKGHTCSQIARAIPGKTRNAIIGKVHRLGLGGRVTPARPVKRKKYPRKFDSRMHAALFPGGPKMKVAPLKMPAAFEKTATAIPLASLTSASCRWPLGDPKEQGFGFCGCDRQEGSPYCPTHTKTACSGFTPARVNAPFDISHRRRVDLLEAA